MLKFDRKLRIVSISAGYDVVELSMAGFMRGFHIFYSFQFLSKFWNSLEGKEIGLGRFPKIKNHESWFFKKQSIIFSQPVTRRRGFNSRLQQQSFIFLQRSGGACLPSNLADETWRVEPRWLDSVKKNPGQDPLLFLEILRSRFLGVWINLPLFPPCFLRVMIDYCEAAAAFPP